MRPEPLHHPPHPLGLTEHPLWAAIRERVNARRCGAPLPPVRETVK